MHEPRNETDGSLPSFRLAILGPLLFFVVILFVRPGDLAEPGRATLAVAAWMAVWWLTGALSLSVTALLPLALFPILGITSPAGAAAPYAHPIIFLFMGGFFLAVAIERWGLHRRLALAVIGRTGTSPRLMLAGFMGVTAFISMWVSNTATAAMMMPIAVAVLRLAGQRPGASPFGTALMLGVGYSASIGGVATIVGTPPNAIFAANAEELAGRAVGFAEWMVVGAPVSAAMLVAAWATLCFLRYRLPAGAVAGMAESIEDERAGLGPWSSSERRTAAVFAATALAWLFRAPKEIGDFTIPGLQTFLPGIGDSTIAMAAAAALFLTPAGPSARRTALLDWDHAKRIPWGILILFGGGLTLAEQFEQTGLTTWGASHLEALREVPDVVMIAIIAILFIFLTELTSNTATAALAMPVMAALGAAMGVSPLPLMAAAALASSLAFMLPVGTPPNAIVFATGYIRHSEMARTGFTLNWISAAIVTITMFTLFTWIFE